VLGSGSFLPQEPGFVIRQAPPGQNTLKLS